MYRILIVLLIFQGSKLSATAVRLRCELSPAPLEKEGNVGQTALLPWLGVLQVQLYNPDTSTMALTGLVLVKEGFAIANADDVAKIPKKIFKQDSKAMFIPRDNETWFCRLLDYMTHPEYRYATANTIALVELDPGDERSYPMKPICLPASRFDLSNLYAIGFTDDKPSLEKSIYSLKYVEPQMCKEFYSKAGLYEVRAPNPYQCGVARTLQGSCVWDNGMVMASNSSGYWTLVGFGIYGPGCAAPARFIDLTTYLPWIDDVTNVNEIKGHIYRKSAFNEGFRKRITHGRGGDDNDRDGSNGGETNGGETNGGETNGGETNGNSTDGGVEELPLTPDTNLTQNYYPFDVAQAHSEYYTIDQVEKDALSIAHVSVPASRGNCSADGLALVFRDEVRVVAKNHWNSPTMGSVHYKISLFDLYYKEYACVTISLKSTKQEKATIFYRLWIENKEGAALHSPGDSPDEILMQTPVKVVTAKPAAPPGAADWRPGPHLKVDFIKDDAPTMQVKNYNVLLTFEFQDEGIIQIQVLGFLHPPTSTTEAPTTEKKRRFYENNFGRMDNRDDRERTILEIEETEESERVKVFKAEDYDRDERNDITIVYKANDFDLHQNTQANVDTASSGRQYCLSMELTIFVYFSLAIIL